MTKSFKKPAKVPQHDITQSMPFSNDAEKGVLSCFLHNPKDLLIDFAQHLPEEAFYHPCNRVLYQTMQLFISKGWPVALIALTQYLQDNKLLDKIGGSGAIPELLDFVPTSRHYSYYRDIMRDKYLLRRIIGACTESIAEAYEYQEDVPGLMTKVESRVTAIVKEGNGMVKRESFKEAVDNFEKDWTERFHKKKESSVPTRWGEWNRHFGGLRPEYHLIKGKTSQGKTTLALNLLATMGVQKQKPCLWFPYEMTKNSLICRLIADLAEVDSRCVFSPDVFVPSKKEMNRIHEAKERIAGSPIEFVKQRNMDAQFIINRSLAFNSEHGGSVGLIGIDYLQKIASPDWGGRNDNTSDRIAHNSDQCFQLQQELMCPMIVISSTNQDGGVLGSQGGDYDTDVAIEVDKVKGFRVPKWRNGPTSNDWIPLNFCGPYIRFESQDEPDEDHIP